MVNIGYKSLWGSVDASVESSYEENYKNSSEYYETNTLSVGGSTDLTLKKDTWQRVLNDIFIFLMQIPYQFLISRIIYHYDNHSLTLF